MCGRVTELPDLGGVLRVARLHTLKILDPQPVSGCKICTPGRLGVGIWLVKWLASFRGLAGRVASGGRGLGGGARTDRRKEMGHREVC